MTTTDRVTLYFIAIAHGVFLGMMAARILGLS